MGKTNPSVTFAIPLFNEEEVIAELRRRVCEALAELPGGPHEIVLVDDGSTDSTAARCRLWAAEDPRVRFLELSRNFGHQAALTAALEYGSGDVVFVLDGDLQDPPELIHEFLAKYHEGFDVVYAKRQGRKEGLILKFCYYCFYRLIRMLSRTELPLDSGDFALLSRRVVDSMNAVPEKRRYLRGLRSWVGYSQTQVPVERGSRFAGRPKYNLSKLLQLAFDGIFSFTLVPLRAAYFMGIFAITGSLIYWLYAAYARLVEHSAPEGFTALASAIFFLAGVQLLFLGVIGEYVGRTYEEVKARPTYIVAEDSRARS
jgi:dolichol-phosphate mannosyltransferase